MDITPESVDRRYKELFEEAETGGYHLHPDVPFVKNLIRGLKSSLSTLSHPIWRCRVCGYICARDAPPLQCPICKVSKDRFERFI
jgi:rubrerythrin